MLSASLSTPIAEEIVEFGLDTAYLYIPASTKLVSSLGTPASNTGGGGGQQQPLLPSLAKNMEVEIMTSLHIGRREADKVYSEWLEYCFPTFLMTYTSFMAYWSEYIPNHDISAIGQSMFRAFAYIGKPYLNFTEFLLGLACIEPNCTSNDVRHKFIFRYYDRNQDGSLSPDEFNELLSDLEAKIPLKKYQQTLAENGNNLTFPVFQLLIGKGILVGVETLCRAPISILERIYTNWDVRNENRRLANRKKKTDRVDQMGAKQSGFNAQSNTPAGAHEDLCLGCREKSYQFGAHCVRLDPNGRCTEPRQIIDCECVPCSR